MFKANDFNYDYTEDSDSVEDEMQINLYENPIIRESRNH